MSELLDYGTGMKRGSGFLMTSSLEDKVLRVCLHGTSVEPNVIVQPSSFQFEAIDVGQTKQKVLMVKNGSVIPIRYTFNKLVNVEVTPKDGWLTPAQSLEFLVSVTPTFGGEKQ